MRNETRKAFNGYLQQVAKLNGVESATEKFNVTPSVQQKLETAIQESSEFLQRINIMGVNEQEGEAWIWVPIARSPAAPTQQVATAETLPIAPS